MSTVDSSVAEGDADVVIRLVMCADRSDWDVWEMTSYIVDRSPLLLENVHVVVFVESYD